MDLSLIFHQMVQLFIIMALGYLLYKVRLIDAEFNKKLTKLLLNFTLPIMILSSVLEQSSERNMAVVAEVFVISLAVYIMLPLASFVLVKAMRLPGHQHGLYMFMLTYANIGFMGFPVIDSLYGSTGVFYAAIMNIIFNVSVFTCGVIQINYGAEKTGGSGINFKNLLSPGVSVSLLAIVIYIANVTLPADIVNVCESVGGITTPLAMILIGATLATMDVKSVFNDWHVYPFALVKLIILPVVMWALLKAFINDEVVLGVTTVLLLMPVANSAVLFATLYGKDEQLAAKNVFITTVISMVTVPGILYLIS